MASKFIKIFNDTVLKQTVLQGYELQRTNDNLGKICMGEVAFTRDTGRLFVGNFSTQELEDDIKYITGGILTGNKYLGIIDSRPLCHFNGNGDTGCYPLNYDKNTSDKDTIKNYPDEIGLFLKGSRYRQFKNNSESFKYGGDGWNKKPEYIQKYGVYSGDYTFDLYNNALILFDNNIKTNSGITTTTSNNKETDISTGKLVWDNTNQKESVKDAQGNDISDTTIIRTPISNINDDDQNSVGNISQYPIYGDGYVVMRILEPDGVTIDYADKKFQNGEPITGEEENKIYQYKNWTHNILKVNYPTNKIFESFDKNNFTEDSNKITLGSADGTLTLPNNITLKGTGWEGDNALRFEARKDYDGTTFTDENPFNDENNWLEDGTQAFLVIDKSGTISYLHQEDVKNNITGGTSVTIPTHTIEIGSGLSLEGNTDTITMGASNTRWKLSLATTESESVALQIDDYLHDPWGLAKEEDDENTGEEDDENPIGNCYYSGTLCFNGNGVLCGVGEYDSTYSGHDNFTKCVTNKYESDKLVSLNHLKIPYLIHYGSGSSEDGSSEDLSLKAQFGTLPIYYKKMESGSSHAPSEEEITNPTENQLYTRVPSNANSVLLEVHHSDAITLYTSEDYNSLPTTAWSIPSKNEPEIKYKTLLYNSQAGCDVIEIPLHRVSTTTTVQVTVTENGVTETYPVLQTDVEKIFQYSFNTSGDYRINLIGYRV